MKHFSAPFTFLFLLTLTSTTGCHQKTVPFDSALHWFQQSAECQAIFIQNFQWAQIRLTQIMQEKGSHDRAIVIDIDETVLDNSPQQAGVLLGLDPDHKKSWDAWCQAAIARPLPGALNFLSQADQLGFAIFYISNRHEKHLSATVKNLSHWDFPQADTEHILLRGEESSKEGRRRKVAEKYQIELFLGDNLNDLSADFELQNAQGRTEAVNKHMDDFRSRFILFPNPMYGSWQSIIPGENGNPALRVWSVEAKHGS